MPTLTVDGITVEVPPGATVLQACEAAGREIPRFCYHERLSIAGNCRMCLVEQEKAPKPIASCAMPAAQGMVIFTNTPKVKKAREGVMEFLLINHPLDCPICDQGGECDLQDQAMAYGRGFSRFDENKRAVTEKYMGPLIKTVMTRCIHCTRCVRFAEEIAGVEEIGAIGRGEGMQITSYLEQAVTSELSGNVIDLCPVGALTSRPYAFEARPWELRKTPGIDVMDAIGSNVRLDARGPEVMRVLPLVNDAVNEEWLSDKSRFAIDGLMHRRLDRPWVRRDGRLQPATWIEAFDAIRAGLAGLSGGQMAAIAGDLLSVEDMVALADFMALFPGARVECRQAGEALDPAQGRASYVLGPTLAGLETADVVLLAGTNPRHEAPLLNTRIRKAVRKGGARVFGIGPAVDLTYPVEWLGDDAALLGALPANVAEALAGAQRPAVLAGIGLARMGGDALAAAAALIRQREGWTGFGIVHTAAARVGGLDLGLVAPGGIAGLAEEARSGRLRALVLHGADELDVDDFAGPFTIYVGHHGDAGVRHADVILPAAAFAEKDGTWVNLEGRIQRGWRAGFPPGEAREDWRILRALSQHLGAALPYDDFEALRARVARDWPQLGREGLEPAGEWRPAAPARVPAGPIAPVVADFYGTNPIARASPTMEACRAEIVRGERPDLALAAE
jgi:NADH-quinone oxidoreductase subunit G